MSDLVERLRGASRSGMFLPLDAKLFSEAASAILRLEGELRDAREEVAQAAYVAGYKDGLDCDGEDDAAMSDGWLNCRDAILSVSAAPSDGGLASILPGKGE